MTEQNISSATNVAANRPNRENVIANESCMFLADNFLTISQMLNEKFGLNIVHGYDVVKKFIYNTLISRIDYLLNIEENIDYKTSLQELLQQNGDISIKYITEKNDDVFYSTVQVNGVNIGVGTGINKKLAEQQAAKSAMKKKNRI